MTEESTFRTYTIRRAFLFPLGLLVLLCVTLFGITIVNHEPLIKLFFLGVIIFIIFVFFMGRLLQRIRLSVSRK